MSKVSVFRFSTNCDEQQKNKINELISNYLNTRGLYYKDQEVEFPQGSEAIHMITALQDETHRFAITYHKQLRSEGQTHSILDDIPGIGAARRKALLLHFKDVDNIKKASLEELANVDGMTKKAAEAVYNFFN